MNWEIKPLGNILTIERGGSPRPIQNYLTDSEDGINWIKISDASASDKYIYKTKEKITKDGLHKTRIVHEDDFLLSNSMSFGRPYIMKTTGCIHDGWLVLRQESNTVFDNNFLYYLLSSPYIFNQFDLLAAGSTVRNLNISLVSSVKVPIPTLEEQQAIVAKLDQAFAAIDQAKANIEKNIANAKELFQSKLNQIFSGKEKLYNYELKRFDEICVLQRGFDLPTHERVKGNFPLVSSNGITDRILDYKITSPGVVTGRSGSIGNVHYIEENFWPLNTSLYIKDFKGNFEKYIYYFLKSIDLKKYSSGAGVPTLNRNFVHKDNFLFVNVFNSQKEIAFQLDQLQEQTKLLVTKYEQKLANLEELKKSILEKAFKGELV